ncbi:MAG: hypothetical protein KAI33_09535, partial [Elusimicrobiales bacterium]|nr:hypothetical protein [Elusimicrobiales bacterium]
MNFKNKETEPKHKSIFSDIMPDSKEKTPAEHHPLPVAAKPQTAKPQTAKPQKSMSDLETKMNDMEKNILLQLKKDIKEQLTEGLKSLQGTKSDDGKALFLSKIAEMENRLKDFQKKELLPLMSKSDDGKTLFLSKIAE